VGKITVNREMSDKHLTSMIGTQGAGKTTASCMLFLTARTLQQIIPNFFCDVDDRNSRIMNDISNLQRGHFPPKTKAFNTYAYQYALQMGWGGTLGKKSTTLNNCDIAGEDLMMTSQYQIKKPDDFAFSAATKLVDYVYNSDIFIFIAPASRALLFENDAQVERESEDTAFDPDVNLASMMGEIFRKRLELKKPIKGIALFITKCDMIDAYVEKQHGWNLYESESDRMQFLNLYFPFSAMKLKNLTNNMSTPLDVFPMFIETKKNVDGSVKRWESGSDAEQPMIDVVNRMPKYSAQQCVDAINFLGKLVT